MRATLEQRIAGTVRVLVASGMPEDDARVEAYRREGVPLPNAPLDPVDVEELQNKLACAERRADAVTIRCSRIANDLRETTATARRQQEVIERLCEALHAAGVPRLVVEGIARGS